MLLLLFAAGALAQDRPVDAVYRVTYRAVFDPGSGSAKASIRIGQSKNLLRELNLHAPSSRYSDFTGDGEIVRDGERLHWKPPPEGGTLHYEARIDHSRNGDYRARITDEWALLRLDRLFPPARARTRAGASSDARLRLSGPPGWSFETRYGPLEGSKDINSPGRNFVRPTGWLAAGVLGVRREIIGGRRIAIAAPRGQDMRRVDITAFLRWNLPRIVRVFPDFPERLLIVGANDDMWRGGLSGPGSLFLHPSVPMISENGTSVLLHELVHIATILPQDTERDDWIIEGLAEYYSLEILRRSGGMGGKRFEQAIAELADWADRDGGQLESPSHGADTARAVVVLHEVQQELERADVESLDEIIDELMHSEAVTGTTLLELVEDELDGESAALRTWLPGGSGAGNGAASPP